MSRAGVDLALVVLIALAVGFIVGYTLAVALC